MESQTKKFSGYKKRIGGRMAWVVNETPTHLKVAFGRITGYTGWSGGAYPVYSFAGPRVLVKK